MPPKRTGNIDFYCLSIRQAVMSSSINSLRPFPAAHFVGSLFLILFHSDVTFYTRYERPARVYGGDKAAMQPFQMHIIHIS